MKAILKATGEMVKITSYTSSPMQRNENDWVSYIDSGGYNHSKEGLLF